MIESRPAIEELWLVIKWTLIVTVLSLTVVFLIVDFMGDGDFEFIQLIIGKSDPVAGTPMTPSIRSIEESKTYYKFVNSELFECITISNEAPYCFSVNNNLSWSNKTNSWSGE